MKLFSATCLAIFAAGFIGLAGCSGEAEVDVETDTTAVDAPTVDADTTMNDVGSAVAGETIETKVEMKLVAEPGFENVEVTSPSQGVIVLNGMVATDAEKTAAETHARSVEGVTEVQNNITVGAQ